MFLLLIFQRKVLTIINSVANFSLIHTTITATPQSLVRVAKPHLFQFIYPTMSEDQGNGDGLIPDPVPGPAVEPPNGEQIIDGDYSTSPPGSLPLVTERGNPRFPKDLLVGGGFEILSNPINFGYSEWLVSATALDLHTSIEAVLLNLVDNALKNRDKKWPELLRLFPWFPKALLEVSQAKRDNRWDWINSKKPADTDGREEVIRHHTFWLKGFGADKAKDDKLIEMNCYKTLNYHAFRAIIRSVANECIVDTPGPVEVGTISRRHWNDLKEPTVNDLKLRVGKKKKNLGPSL